jgi:hypothetical protein
MSNKKEKFELGPLQKLWVETLRKYPERQHRETLGYVGGHGLITCCCLGQLLLCNKELRGEELKYGSIYDGEGHLKSGSTLSVSYSEFGLRNSVGSIEDGSNSLAVMNDTGKTWLEIADYIETNADKLFLHSV